MSWSAQRRRLATILIFGATALGCVSRVGQAEGGTDGPLYAIKYDRRMIVAQLQLSVKLAEKASRSLRGGLNREELTRVDGLAYESYRLLRYAMHGLDGLLNEQRPKGFVDPIIKQVHGMVLRAMEYNRTARAQVEAVTKYAQEAAGRLAVAVENMNHAIRLTRQGLTLL
jgi:hypothetical protein